MSSSVEKLRDEGLPKSSVFNFVQLGSPTKYLRRLSISHKFYFIITVVAVILIFELASFWFAISTMSSIRAYVEGEGLWSKAQKESFNSLLQYSSSFNQSDYTNFLSSLTIPLGDNKARLELERPHANVAIARQGFTEGGNNPADIGGMIFLFQHFSQVSYLKQAIGIWTQGDAQIQTQLSIGQRMHALIESDPHPNDPATSAALRPLVAEAVQNDNALTPLEGQFSATLGNASRDVGNLFLYAVLILTIIFGLSAFIAALFIAKLVARVDAAKSEFVALASHQLRSPLNTINLSVEYLKILGPPRSFQEKNVIESISREVEQMALLIETILSVSRIELGTLIIEPEMMDIVPLAKEEVGALTMLARNKGLLIKEFYDPEELLAPMDATLLKIIFQNLLSNAIKYTPYGREISLTIELQSSRILICVADTGYGIPKHEQHRIFDKLFRAANARKLDPQGTGLGLYIVKSIVTEAGGKIWFESAEGVGTTFYVALSLSGMKKVRGNTRLS
jgi:signal transduction histidine kinase